MLALRARSQRGWGSVRASIPSISLFFRYLENRIFHHPSQDDNLHTRNIGQKKFCLSDTCTIQDRGTLGGPILSNTWRGFAPNRQDMTRHR
uniref:Uncharacterized protein n=1 Tax=Candidatus Kentrum sp. LFY TaxID=2126342 RepID=A0A450UHT6_9GAMM|nr:MAG: hypothetical protein BECKLFY1418B_GA0070995_103113 [Candidatus Kentron sp. LFY]VFK14441.1 MAG: hypothetical protein BECKLFY1418C_GA0070996_100840 [Candidatus Kentron sp. LFY]